MNPTGKTTLPGRIFRTLLGVAIVAGGLYLAYEWMSHKPRARKRHGASHAAAPLVQVISPRPIDVPAMVETFGTAVPYRTQTLASRVSSQIVDLSPRLVPGSVVKKGELLVRLDPSDYELALRQRAADVAAARLALETELENQKSAKFEFSLSGQKLTGRQKAYLLRFPHVAAAREALKAAEAAYEKAKIDLQRCEIRAPFDGVVLSVTAAKGDVVSASKTLATLARADRFWIRAVVSPAALRGIDIPGFNAQRGSKVEIFHQGVATRKPFAGGVEELEKRVDENSRMAYLLIGVEDPLGLYKKRPKGDALLLGEYLYLKIYGKLLKNVLQIPSDALRNGDTLWILRPDHRLHIQKVPILWREEGRFYIPADVLTSGESVVITVIEAPVEGMRLRVAGPKSAAGERRASSSTKRRQHGPKEGR